MWRKLSICKSPALKPFKFNIIVNCNLINHVYRATGNIKVTHDFTSHNNDFDIWVEQQSNYRTAKRWLPKNNDSANL